MLSLEMVFDDGRSRIIEPEDSVTPEKVFDRQWALTVIEQSMNCLENKYREKGKQSIFDALRFVISPGEAVVSYAEVAEKEGISESAFKVADHRLRDRFGKELRLTIRDTMLEEEDVEEEIRWLFSAFGEEAG